MRKRICHWYDGNVWMPFELLLHVSLWIIVDFPLQFEPLLSQTPPLYYLSIYFKNSKYMDNEPPMSKYCTQMGKKKSPQNIHAMNHFKFMEFHKSIKFLYMFCLTWHCSKVVHIPHKFEGFCIPHLVRLDEWCKVIVLLNFWESTMWYGQPPIVECQKVAITKGKWSVQVEVVWPPPPAEPPFENNATQPQHSSYLDWWPSLHFILAKIWVCSKFAHSSHNDPEP